MKRRRLERLGKGMLGIILAAALVAGCGSAGTQGESPNAAGTESAEAGQADAAGTENAEAGQADAAGTEGTEASSSEGEAYTLPIGDGETDNLTVACLEGWYTAVSINDNLEIWQAIEDRTGVKINWEASADYDTVMQPRIAAGSDLPDIFDGAAVHDQHRRL